jgi:hypothetical protein
MHNSQLAPLVEAANRVRADDFKVGAEEIAAMIDDPDLELLVGLWTDLREPSGIAAAALKGTDIVEECNARGRSRTLSTFAFWLRNEEHFLSLREEVAKLVEQATSVRGEFHPIADDLAFEFVPSADDPDELYVTKAGARIARRGYPGTREARRWIALIPGYTVRDITANKIEVCFADVVRMHIGDQTAH